jgi:hypothetical protein
MTEMLELLGTLQMPSPIILVTKELAKLWVIAEVKCLVNFIAEEQSLMGSLLAIMSW